MFSCLFVVSRVPLVTVQRGTIIYSLGRRSAVYIVYNNLWPPLKKSCVKMLFMYLDLFSLFVSDIVSRTHGEYYPLARGPWMFLDLVVFNLFLKKNSVSWFSDDLMKLFNFYSALFPKCLLYLNYFTVKCTLIIWFTVKHSSFLIK